MSSRKNLRRSVVTVVAGLALSFSLVGINAFAQVGTPPLWNGTEFNDAIYSTGADKLHNIGITGRGVTAAVVNGGFYTDHEIFDYDGVFGGRIVNDYMGPEGEHGTHVSGTVMAMAPDAHLWLGTFSDEIASFQGILADADEYNIVAVNNSWGLIFSGLYGTPEEVANAWPVPNDLLEQMRDQNITVVGASGNSGINDRLGYVDGLPSVLAVGALSPTGLIADFSNQYQKDGLFILAPGVNIYSSVGTDGLGESYYGWMDGTSMATPHVTGAVTLLASGARNATAGEIIASLYDSADPVHYDGSAIVPRAMSTANYDPALVRDAYVNALAGSEDLSKYTDWLTAAADRYAADEMTADDWRIMWHILETANSVASYADGTRTVFLNYIELAGGLNPLQHTEYGFLRVDKAYMDLTHKRTEIIADNIGGGLGGVMDAFADALYDGAALDQMGADLFQRIDGPDVRTQTAVARQMSPMFLNATAESAHYGMSGLHRALGRRTEMHRLGQLGKTPQVPNGASAHGTQQGFAPLGNQWGAPVRMSETSGWLEGFGGGMDRDGSFSQTGYDGSFAGMSFGLEYSKLGRSVGLFGNYANHSVDSTDGRSKGDWGNIGIYARRERTCSFIEASMSMGFGDYDIHRNIFIPGAIFEDVGGGYIVLDPISARANGQSDAFSFSARLAGGRDLWDLAGWKVGTRAEMSLSCLGFDSYEETGAGALNLNIDNYGSSYWEGGVGLFAGKHFFFQTPLLKKRQHIQHRMQHLVASGKIMAMAGGMLGGDIDAQFADYGTSFSVDPDNDCDIWLLPEVTLSWNVRPGMVISGSYFGRWGDDITDNAGSLALNLFW